MPEIQESAAIKGVYTVQLRPFADSRGRFIETFRKEWFPLRTWDIIQTNRSDSTQGVLRGLHYHKQQVDYWYVMNGRLRTGMVDLRPDSPTHLAVQMVEMDADVPLGLFIPIGVAHGFVALTDCTLTYIVDNYYDSTDEYGVVWNDPQISMDWGVEAPLVSERDQNNPRLDAIQAEDLVYLKPS